MLNRAELTSLKLDILNFFEGVPKYESYTASQLAYLLNEEKDTPFDWEQDGDSLEYLDWKNSVRFALSVLRRQKKLGFTQTGYQNAYHYWRK